MLAILDLNPDAFINGNINQLKSGQTLKLPTSEQATRRSGSQAVAEVAEQNRAWQEGRSAPVTRAPQEPSAPQLDARQRENAGSAPEEVDAEDSLRLVSGADEQVSEGDGEAGGNSTAKLRDSLDMTKEQLDAAEREKAEMVGRLDDVQGQLETLQRLLELKDAQLAALQQEISASGQNSELPAEPQADLEEIAALEQQASEAAIAEEQADGLAANEETLAEAAEVMETTEPEVEAVDPELVSEDLAAEEPQAEDATVDLEEPVAPVVEAAETESEAAVAQPADEPEMATAESLLQRMMQNQMLLVGGGVVAILLLLMVLMAVSRRNARREADMNDNFIANAAEGQDGDSSSLESVLNEALNSEPERTDLRLKLLEVEGMLDNAEGYRAQHEALRAAGTVDDQVDAMDARFPLMAAAVAGAAAGLAYDASADEDISFEMPADTTEAEVPEEDMDFDFSEFELGDTPAAAAVPEDAPKLEPEEPEEVDFDLDFDLDDTLSDQDLQGAVEPGASAADAAVSLDESLEFTEVESLEPAVEDKITLDDDFDLSLTDDLQSTGSADDFASLELDETANTEKTAEEDFSLSDDDLADFELELDEVAGSAENADVALPLDSLELDEEQKDDELMALDNVMEEPVAGDLDEDDEFDFLSGTDESATKLDLARAYIDMGDSEGARDILNEVVEEGDEQQKQEAREMMERLTD